MKITKYKPGMNVLDKLPSLGFGVVKRVCKHTVHVKFIYHNHITIYDEEHLQFLEAVK